MLHRWARGGDARGPVVSVSIGGVKLDIADNRSACIMYTEPSYEI